MKKIIPTKILSASERQLGCIRAPIKNRMAVWDWAQEHNIKIEYKGSFTQDRGFSRTYDWWQVEGEHNRLMFMLRWAS